MFFVKLVVVLALHGACFAGIASASNRTYERVVEWTFESKKHYADPFNDVDVDVIFRKEGQSWRVPAFWRGGQKWTVRFAPPIPGEFLYEIESSDATNDHLNGLKGRVSVLGYRGSNPLLRHGTLRVSDTRRYLEHADGTPFYWLGDTWWTGLSARLSWGGFQSLVADRKKKGFTVVQLVAGLVPLEEPPSDPGFCNEGGCVWESKFERINPAYFDFADRRIQLLVDNGLVPAIAGGWNPVLRTMGVQRMQKHWRYIIARYGAYPVLWVLGGEVLDPPDEAVRKIPETGRWLVVQGWTDVAKYLRSIDPYHHPLTAHEWVPPLDVPLRDDSLTDFDLLQSGHSGWPALAVNVAQLNLRYARTSSIKPVVQGEIGYENHYYRHYADFQRAAFWLSMLNGAAGHTYGADATWGAYAGDQPLHRTRMSFLSWKEGMNLPGSYQVGIGAKLLRRYKWWLFEPRPDWVIPRGTTLLEPRYAYRGDELGSWPHPKEEPSDPFKEMDYPLGEWKARNGSVRGPYAAGIPGAVRFIYTPKHAHAPPTVLGLEIGVRYRAFLWEPELGIKFDLGVIQRPMPGTILFREPFGRMTAGRWVDHGINKSARSGGMLSARGDILVTAEGIKERDIVAEVEFSGSAHAALVVRYRDPENYVAAVYSPEQGAIWIMERHDGKDSLALGSIRIETPPKMIRFTMEVRGSKGMTAVSDGSKAYSTPIVDLNNDEQGGVGLLHAQEEMVQTFDNFIVRRSPTLVTDTSLDRTIYDAEGNKRGDLVGGDSIGPDGQRIPGWGSFARDKHILLDAYRPSALPTIGDWLLILDATTEPQLSNSCHAYQCAKESVPLQ